MKKIPIYNQKGFTLIEVMIAVGLFVVIMVYGIGSVLSTNNAHKKSQSQRAINDNLSFVIEDMSRNIRLGSNYRCPINPGSVSNSDGYTFSISTVDFIPQDCVPGDESFSLSFDPMNANVGDITDISEQMGYFIFDDGAIYKMSQNTFGGSIHNFIRITSPEIVIDRSKSGFTVVGTEVIGMQPRVIIRLSGTVKYKTIVTPFDIQTTVSQRVLEQ